MRKTVRESLDLLLRDRKNEFRELAESLKIPSTTDDWEVIILKFCLDFEDCFRIWTDVEEPNAIKNNKCMTIMREISRGKKHVSEVIVFKTSHRRCIRNFTRSIRESLKIINEKLKK